MSDEVLVARGLVARAAGTTQLDGIDVTLARGRTLGVLGESGAGKSTLVRVLAGLRAADGGRVLLDGRPFTAPTPRIQVVFQDPAASLNPRHRVGRVLGQAVRAHDRRRRANRRTAAALDDAVAAALDGVALAPALASRRPAELSGGQRQRVAIARALIAEPDVLLLDEPVTALDHDTADGVLRLVASLRHGRACLLVSHAVGPLCRLADDLVVLRSGTVVESGLAADMLDRPGAEYTRALLGNGRSG